MLRSFTPASCSVSFARPLVRLTELHCWVLVAGDHPIVRNHQPLIVPGQLGDDFPRGAGTLMFVKPR